MLGCALFLAATAARATVLEDPDDGEIGDLFRYLGEDGGAAAEGPAADPWVAEVRAERGLDEPLRPVTAGEARAELEEPPLAADEVRFSVDEEEGWIEYLIQEDTVSLHRNASVEYGEMTLTADRVRFFSGRDLVIAEGYCELHDPNQTMFGSRMSYDLESGKGVILHGDAESTQGYYRGTRIKKIEERTIAAQRGRFTTCDLGEPHYHFWSPRLKVYLDDKVVARPAVLFMGEVPIAASPFYFFSLRKDRHSGFLPPYIRFRRRGDFTVDNGFYWVLNDYSDVTFQLDYNSVDGYRKSANLVYLYGSRSTVNNFYISHMRRRAITATETSTGRDAMELLKIYATHRQDISDSAAALLRLDLRNNTKYDDIVEEEFEIRAEENLESFFNISQTWEDYQLSAEGRYTRDKTREGDSGSSSVTLAAAPPHHRDPYGNIIQRTRDPFPRINFYATRKELLESRFYYQYDASWVNYYDFEEAGSVLKEGNADVSVSRPFSLLRYLRVDPGAGGHGYWYDRDRFGRNHRFLGTWDTSVALSTKIYGIFDRGDTTFRHIVNPTAAHFFRPDIDQSWMVDGGAVYPEESRISLALRQSLDVKLPPAEEEDEAEKKKKEEGDDARSWEEVYRPSRHGTTRAGTSSVPRLRKAGTVGEVVNLATWDTTTSYNLGPLPYEGAREFGDLDNTIEITPNFRKWYYLSHRIQFSNDFYSLQLLDFDITTTASFTTGALRREEDTDQSWEKATDPYGRPRESEDSDLDPNVYNIDTLTGRRFEAGEGLGRGWNFSLTHDYHWTRGDEGYEPSVLHSVRGAVSFNLTKKWRLGYDTYYDITDGKLISEHYRIYRNLHRWEAELRIVLEREEFEYWFQVRLIDIPEIELYGTQRRYF